MNIIKTILLNVLGYLRADWLILLIGILIAVSVKVYVDPMKFKRLLEKNSKLSIPGSVAFGAFTPLCACGTMAVLLSMFMATLPWGPVVAFLVSSPLTSPSEFMFQTAFFGSRFAVAVLISSIVLGVGGGFIAHILDKKTNFFKNQFRLIDKNNKKEVSCCSETAITLTEETFIEKFKIRELLREFINIGIKKVLLFFIIFITLGQIVEMIIPKDLILSLFGSNNSYSIPLGATIGLPLYVSGPSALPLMKSFFNSGAGEGAILAFLITGKATGVPVITGMATILKKRAILFYVGLVYVGGLLSGYLYKFILQFIGKIY